MTALSIFAALLLFGYLGAMAWKHGIPDMVSDTYYQLGKRGCIFIAVMAISAILMMVAILDSERGLQAAAFIGTMGLVFVGFAPNYLDKDEYKVHKGAAIVSATGCLAWCLSVNIWPTLALATAYAAYLFVREVFKAMEGVWWAAPAAEGWHPWYWAEVAAFADIFLTYWVCNLR